jgi:hypothetical protein
VAYLGTLPELVGAEQNLSGRDSKEAPREYGLSSVAAPYPQAPRFCRGLAFQMAAGDGK